MLWHKRLRLNYAEIDMVAKFLCENIVDDPEGSSAIIINQVLYVFQRKCFWSMW
jgi:hypothetical protein